MIQPPAPGCLARFVTSADNRAERLAHAWDLSSAEYVPVPWGSPALVLGHESSEESGWTWIEVLTEGRTLLALSDDLEISTGGSAGDLES